MGNVIWELWGMGNVIWSLQVYTQGRKDFLFQPPVDLLWSKGSETLPIPRCLRQILPTVHILSRDHNIYFI